MGGIPRPTFEGTARDATWLTNGGPMAGIAMQGVLWATLVGGGLASSAFSWPTDPFSVVGSTGGALATAFNLGLIAGGVLALPVAAWLWTAWRPLIGAIYGLTGLSFVLAGVFPIPSPLHELAAAIFVFAWLLCWIAAADDWRGSDRRIAALEFALGAAAVAVWLPYDFAIASAQIGYGAAEAVAIGAFSVWTVLTVFRRRGRSRSEG